MVTRVTVVRRHETYDYEQALAIIDVCVNLDIPFIVGFNPEKATWGFSLTVTGDGIADPPTATSLQVDEEAFLKP